MDRLLPEVGSLTTRVTIAMASAAPRIARAVPPSKRRRLIRSIFEGPPSGAAISRNAPTYRSTPTPVASASSPNATRYTRASMPVNRASPAHTPVISRPSSERRSRRDPVLLSSVMGPSSRLPATYGHPGQP